MRSLAAFRTRFTRLSNATPWRGLAAADCPCLAASLVSSISRLCRPGPCAIGVAMCLVFALPDNFRFPYAAIGFSDF